MATRARNLPSALAFSPQGGQSGLNIQRVQVQSRANFSDSVRWSLDLRYQKTGTPTGRPFHPEFIARSCSHPETELTGYTKWCRRWTEALESSRGLQAHRVD